MPWLILIFLLMPGTAEVPCAHPGYVRECSAEGCSECRPA